VTGTLEPFSLSLSSPLETARGTIDAREGVLVRVEAAGTEGVGEATPLPGWTESLEECRAALERVLDAGDSGDRDAALAGLDGAPAGVGGTPAARHGLALALADARARAAGAPLYRHLDGDRRAGDDRRVERVPVNATVGDGSPETTASDACAAVAEGFRALKIKIGARSVDEDVARLRTVREAVGHDVELRADANGAWTHAQARDALPSLAGTGVAYVEQPLSPADLAGHAALREGSASDDGAVGIALDETLAETPIGRVLDAGVADVLVLKPMVLGGPDRAREAALRAREAGVTPVVTTTIDAALARAGAAHVVASLPDAPRSACGLATGDRLAEDLLADPAPIADGFAQVPQEPGNAPPPPDEPRTDS
jgi:o-succinylbenzoate synthase